jgi:hypothetical protein
MMNIVLTSMVLILFFKIILKGICVIVFLPHIYDSSKNERNDYLKILEDGATT